MTHQQLILLLLGFVVGITLFNVWANWQTKRRTKQFIKEFRSKHWQD